MDNCKKNIDEYIICKYCTITVYASKVIRLTKLKESKKVVALFRRKSACCGGCPMSWRHGNGRSNGVNV